MSKNRESYRPAFVAVPVETWELAEGVSHVTPEGWLLDDNDRLIVVEDDEQSEWNGS
jgi:hypothetical protein